MEDPDYFENLPMEKYPSTEAELKSKEYYLAQVDVYMDENYGWVFDYTERNGMVLQILNDFYGLNSRDIITLLHPNEKENDRLREELFQHEQALENSRDFEDEEREDVEENE